MTTIVNTPPSTPESSGSGFFIGIMVFVLIVGIALYFGTSILDWMRPTQINVPAAQVNVESPQVVVPAPVEVVTAE